MHSRNTGGKPELITLAIIIASSASDVSALLVCTALQPQITHRYCSKFNVVPLLIWMSRNKTTVSPSVVSDSHRWVGKLPGSNSSALSVGWIRLYHVPARHSPTCLCQQSSQQTMSRSRLHSSLLFSGRVHAVANHTSEPHRYLDYRSKWSISECTWISGTSVQQKRVNDTYIHTHNYSTCGLLSWSMWGSLRLAPIHNIHNSNRY